MIECIEHINVEIKIWRIALTPVEAFERTRDAEELCQTQVQLHKPRPLTGIARSSPWPVIGYCVTVVVQPCGDVKWDTAAEHKQHPNSEATRQLERARISESVSLVEIRPASFWSQVIIVRREREWTARVVSRARQALLRHALEPLAYTAAESQAENVTAHAGRRLDLIDIEKIWIGALAGLRQRRIDITRAQQMHAP